MIIKERICIVYSNAKNKYKYQSNNWIVLSNLTLAASASIYLSLSLLDLFLAKRVLDGWKRPVARHRNKPARMVAARQRRKSRKEISLKSLGRLSSFGETLALENVHLTSLRLFLEQMSLVVAQLHILRLRLQHITRDVLCPTVQSNFQLWPFWRQKRE